MHDSDRLFVELSPPPGGLQRLQRRLAINPPRPRQRNHWVPLGAALATGLLVLATWLPGVIAQQQQTHRLISALHASIATPVEDLQVTHGAAIALPSGDPAVQLYLVISATPATTD
ncbi:hypothetical protein PY254_04800 [Rhodanobacter sp. AS-Z3]|uniref:hypothetical protein n=1 Tax=Rhodanobacter sp. AS-Z3 TaxID=3031330 RepID=UPI00247AF821|nr:hypothetical protein [Rhodanobacter sp. AS-Z3]WEN15995.1 hypothetical protein PY254_04800 [Rhodanobacter sp. AS-Z3]